MSLNARDIQEMLRLVAEVAALNAPRISCCQRMLRGISSLTQAPVVLDADLLVSRSTAALQLISAHVLGLHSSEMIEFDQHSSHHATRDLVLHAVAPILTRLQGVLGNSSVPSAAQSTVTLRPSPAEHFTCSLRHHPNSNVAHLLAVCRPAECDSFTQREQHIVQLLHEQVERVSHVPLLSARDGMIQLPPYLRRLVPELLAGGGEKQIAAKLGFTFNTTHQYIKAIYRRLGVSSRAEFMARCMQPELPAPQSAVFHISREVQPVASLLTSARA